MSKGETRWIIVGSLVVVAGLATIGLHHRGRIRATGAADEAAGRFAGLASGPLDPSVGPPTPRTPDELKRDVDGAMTRWRTAVVVKDAETVLALDLTFRQLPDLYSDALAKSAETEGNERVRAFSTRVLGKLKRPNLEPLYERLLVDRSVYVRQNAAWALGELGAAADASGRAAAEHAVPELRHVRARDPANEVRLAAKDALNKLE